jgi:hypothetical protein
VGPFPSYAACCESCALQACGSNSHAPTQFNQPPNGPDKGPGVDAGFGGVQHSEEQLGCRTLSVCAGRMHERAARPQGVGLREVVSRGLSNPARFLACRRGTLPSRLQKQTQRPRHKSCVLVRLEHWRAHSLISTDVACVPPTCRKLEFEPRPAKSGATNQALAFEYLCWRQATGLIVVCDKFRPEQGSCEILDPASEPVGEQCKLTTRNTRHGA